MAPKFGFVEKSWLREVELSGKSVRLVPLRMEHAKDLTRAASDGELWRLWYTSVPDPAGMQTYLRKALDDQAAGKALPFTIIDTHSDQVMGSTRFLNVEPEFRRLEIGATWYADSYQRTGANTECKYLLLQHAFETLDCIAVEFRTNWFNYRSRNAILRLGAKQDGVLRNHRIDSQGILRDTVVFSIVRQEWPTVRKSLTFQMDRHA